MNKRQITGLMALMAMLSMIFIGLPIPRAQAVSDTFTAPGLPGYVVEARPGGFFLDSTSAVSVAELGQDVYTGYLFPNVDIYRNATINSATLKLWYGAGHNWNTTQDTFILVQGIRGSPTILEYDTVMNPATTAASTTYKISDWNASQVYSIDVTDIVDELTEQFMYNSDPTWDNIAIRIWAITPVGPWVPGTEPDYYDYQVASNIGAFSAHKPELDINWTLATETDQEYKGYVITPGAGISGNFMAYNSSGALVIHTAQVDGDNVTEGIGPLPINPDDNKEGICSVGGVLYMVNGTGLTPFDFHLLKSIDGGLNWIYIGQVGTTGINSGLKTLIYDLDDTIHIAYKYGYDVRYINYTLSSGNFSAPLLIHDGAYSLIGLRGYWDILHDTIWFTSTGGHLGGSVRRATVMRKANGGAWEEYSLPTDERRYSQVVEIDEVMYWGIHAYSVTPASNALVLYNLTTYSDLTSWNLIGSVAGSGELKTFDLAKWIDGSAEKLLIAVEVEIPNRIRIGDSSDGGISFNNFKFFNFTDKSETLEYNEPLFYYAEDGEVSLVMRVFYQGATYHYLTYGNHTWFRSNHTEGSALKVFETSKNGLLYAGRDQRPYAEGVGAWIITPPPGAGNDTTCIDNYLAEINNPTIEDVKDAIDFCLVPGDPGADPEDPGEGPWDESDPWYLDRQRFKMYILIIGLSCIIFPWMILARNRDFSYIFMALFLNLLGVALLYMVGTI